MAGSSEPAFSFEYKKGAIAPWMITHLFCNSPFLYGGVFDEKPGDRNFTSDPADDLDSYDKEKTGGNG